MVKLEAWNEWKQIFLPKVSPTMDKEDLLYHVWSVAWAEAVNHQREKDAQLCETVADMSDSAQAEHAAMICADAVRSQ